MGGAGRVVVVRDRPARGRFAPRAWDAAAAGASLLSSALVALVVRPTWLGGGALAVTVAIEAAVLVLTAAAVLVVETSAGWLLVFPLVTWVQWASLRASSRERGVGPLSLLRRPWRFWRGAGPAVRT